MRNMLIALVLALLPTLSNAGQLWDTQKDMQALISDGATIVAVTPSPKMSSMNVLDSRIWMTYQGILWVCDYSGSGRFKTQCYQTE